MTFHLLILYINIHLHCSFYSLLSVAPSYIEEEAPTTQQDNYNQYFFRKSPLKSVNIMDNFLEIGTVAYLPK